MKLSLSILGFVLLGLPSATAGPIGEKLQSESLDSHNPFSPPASFKNQAIQQVYEFSKSYPRISATITFENVGSQPGSFYYIPFSSHLLPNVGGIQAKEKTATDRCNVTLVEVDPLSPTQYYRITLNKPLQPKAKLTLQVAFTTLADLRPVPKAIPQSNAKQYLQADLSAYFPSCYPTEQQVTIMRFPSADIPDYTILPDPSSKGTEFPAAKGRELTYGPWTNVPANSMQPVQVRYEYSHPIAAILSLERNIEISHWGGNIAFEEHYELTNLAANLSKQFSRTEFQKSNLYNAGAPTTALKGLGIPLPPGSLDAYFTDDIGNVSTSKFRTSRQEAILEIRPRYPVFGGWRYKFRIGWDNHLGSFLRRIRPGGSRYILQAPFVEGPRNPEGAQYRDVRVNVILPEGAENVEYAVPPELQTAILGDGITKHKSFLDTVGRTKLSIRARNLNDEMAGKPIVVKYDYGWLAGMRKPLNVFLLCSMLFLGAGILRRIDYSIGAKKGS